METYDSQPFHSMLYGFGGAGKSVMAASAALPQVILLTDGLGKARPYLDGMIARRRELPIKLNTGETKLEMIQVFNPSDTERKSMQRLIFNFVDKNAREPIAYKQFEYVFPIVDTYMDMIKGKTLIQDSFTTLQILYRSYAEKDQNGFKSEWDWMNPLTTRAEQICMDLLAKPYNTIVIAHTSQGKTTVENNSLYVTSMPGRMADRAMALHDNTLHVYVDRDGTHWCQATGDGVFVANNNFSATGKVSNDFPTLMAKQKKIIWE